MNTKNEWITYFIAIDNENDVKIIVASKDEKKASMVFKKCLGIVK